MKNALPAGTQQPLQEIALEILQLTRSTVLVQLRFLELALSRLEFVPDPEVSFATDGQSIYYNDYHVVQQYRLGLSAITADYLHSVLHCVLHHPFVGTQVDQRCWDLAADIAVEAILDELALPGVSHPRQRDQTELLQRLRKELKNLTAEKVYRYLRNQKLAEEALLALRQPFLADEHRDWYRPSYRQEEDSTEDEAEESNGEDGEQTGTNGSRDSETGEQPSDEGKEQQGTAPEDAEQKTQSAQSRSQIEADWKEIARQMQTDLETFSHRWGTKSGDLTASLYAVNRERFDYTRFLQQFAQLQEVMQVNDEEFDYLFYTYGLQLYGNIPLVEPLEYAEQNRIRQFVIAVDTSASVKERWIQRFVERTRDILLSQQTFDERIELYLIQCDAKLQTVTRIDSAKELSAHSLDFELRGFGGTDFRPVFEYVEQLQKQGMLQQLKGLIYFTDGDGTYPAAPAPYKTAFLFPEDARPQRVPPWIIRATLDLDEFDEEQL